MKNYHRILFLLLMAGIIVAAAFIGRYQTNGNLRAFFNNALLKNLILQIRLPRIIISLLVGAGLAAAGLIMQTIFQNALADPGVLGISQAAGFGAALGILLFPTTNISVQVFAFISGIISMVFVLNLARILKTQNRVALIFAGIAVSAFFSAGLGIIKYLADPLDQLPSIVFWLLGSLSTANWTAVIQIAPITVICIVLLYLLRWRINVYALNDSVLFSLGIKKNLEIYLILGISVLLTTTIISFSGLIGWVGLIIPNLAKLGFGYNLRRSLPASLIIGAIFILFCDTIARASIAGEIPLGIITAFIGASLFVVLITTQRSFT